MHGTHMHMYFQRKGNYFPLTWPSPGSATIPRAQGESHCSLDGPGPPLRAPPKPPLSLIPGPPAGSIFGHGPEGPTSRQAEP